MTNPATIQRPSLEGALAFHEKRIQRIERMTDTPWVYVGSGDPGSPDFVNGSNIRGEAPLSFLMTINGWLELRGGFTGVDPGQVIFVLPDGTTSINGSQVPGIDYRPLFRQELILPFSDGSSSGTVAVDVDGTVTWLGEIAPGSIRFDFDNVGGWLLVEADDPLGIPGDFSQPAAASATGYGLAFNSGALGMLITSSSILSPQPALTIDTRGSRFGPALNLLTQAGQPLVAETSATGADAATAVQGTARAVDAVALGVEADAHTTGTGEAVGVRAVGDASAGSGDAIGVEGQALPGSGAGVAFRGRDHTGAVIFEVRDDGSIHGKTGAGPVVFDL